MRNRLFNLGTLGSVSDGKSEMIYQLSGGDLYSGIRTQRDSREKKRNITIKAGYANIKIFKCNNCESEFSSKETLQELQCLNCDNNCELIKHISFVDCPGHQELIETMMCSVSLMNGAIVVVSITDPIKKKPQLLQHLIAAKINNLKIIICINKCDLVSIETVKERKLELDEILNKLNIIPCTIIPTSFTNRLGLDYLIKAINIYFNDVELNTNSKTLFRITRSFDINKPGINFNEIKGGCLGGSLISGKLNINDEVEINPGILKKEKNGKYTNIPIITNLLSFESDKINLNNISSGGLVGILTNIDPYYCKNDLLKGNIITKVGESLPVYNQIKVEFNKLDDDIEWIPKNGNKVYLHISNMSSEATISKFKDNIINFEILKPLCIDISSTILICIKQPNLKIIGIGKIII